MAHKRRRKQGENSLVEFGHVYAAPALLLQFLYLAADAGQFVQVRRMLRRHITPVVMPLKALDQLLALLRPPSGKGLKSREHTGMDGFVQIGLRQVADLVHSAIRQGRYQECVDLVSEYR